MRLDELVPLVKNLVAKDGKNGLPNGLICLKGGDISDEMKSYKKFAMETNLKDYFDEDFFDTKKIVYVQL